MALPARELIRDKARQPFRRCIVPSTTCKHANGSRLPCRAHRRTIRSSFYLGHAPSLQGLKHQGVSALAPGTNPAPADLPALAMVDDSIGHVG